MVFFSEIWRRYARIFKKQYGQEETMGISEIWSRYARISKTIILAGGSYGAIFQIDSFLKNPLKITKTIKINEISNYNYNSYIIL